MCFISMRNMSLVVGWMHLVTSSIVSIALLIYLCMYNNKTYEDTFIEFELSIIGLHTLLLLFMISVASVIFDVLLLKGISEERVKLMSPFVYGNYFILGLIIFSTLITILADIIAGVTFGDLMIHFILNGVYFGITLAVFCPVHLHYKELQLKFMPPPQEHHPLQETITPHVMPNYMQGDDV